MEIANAIVRCHGFHDRRRRCGSGTARRRARRGSPATNRFPIATPCSPRWPTESPPFPATPPAPTAPPRWPASARSAHAYARREITLSRSKAAAFAGCSRRRRPLDAANSGTTMRLMSGILAAHPMRTTISGDGSLSNRPMRRVIDPLTRMGARIESQDGRPPLTITGADLRPIEHAPEVPSAQVKSAVMLAGPADRGADDRERAGSDPGSYRARAGVVRCAGGGRRPARVASRVVSDSTASASPSRATFPARHSGWRSPPERLAHPSRSRASA